LSVRPAKTGTGELVDVRRSSLHRALLSRRSFLYGAGCAGLAIGCGLLPACENARFINVLAPPSTLRPRLLRRFEEETGIQVRPGSWVSPTDALGKLFASSAEVDMMIALSDLLTPVVPEAIARNLLTALNPSQAPALRDIAAPFQTDMAIVDGKLFTIPMYWGYNAVLYNRAVVPDSEPLIGSWGLIFDDKFRGKVSLKDDAHESIMPTALYMGHPQPLEMDRADLKEVTRFLISKKRNFRALWGKFAEAVQLMTSGEVNALYGYPLMLHTLATQGMNVAANQPREGLLVFVQSAFIPRRSNHPADALAWINFLLSGDVGELLTREAAVLSPFDKVRSRFSADEQRHFGYDALTGDVHLVRLGRPKHLDLWIEAWAEFKAA